MNLKVNFFPSLTGKINSSSNSLVFPKSIGLILFYSISPPPSCQAFFEIFVTNKLKVNRFFNDLRFKSELLEIT